MDIDYDKPHRRLDIDLSEEDALGIIEGRSISESTRRKVGEIVTVRFVPIPRQRYDESLAIGDLRHLRSLESTNRLIHDPRVDTSRVHIRGNSVQIWMRKSFLASNAFASEEITDTITGRQNPLGIQRVHIRLPDLEDNAVDLSGSAEA